MAAASWFLRGVFVFKERTVDVEGEFTPPLTVYVGPNGGGKTLFLASLSFMSSAITQERRLAIISGSSLIGAFNAFIGKIVINDFNGYLAILFKDANWERYKDLALEKMSEMSRFEEVIEEQMAKTPPNHYNVINISRNKTNVSVNKVFSYHPYDVKDYKENYRPMSDGETAKELLQSLLENAEKGDLLIFDAPESFLDPENMSEIVALMGEKIGEGVMMAVSTHSLEFLSKLALEVKVGYVVRLEGGRAVKRWKVQSVLERGKDVRVEKTFN